MEVASAGRAKSLFDGAKRLFDMSAGILLLVFFSPLLAVIALLIKRSSPGPALFRQARAGRHNRTFYIYKFRTMHCGADCSGPQITSSDDNRVTPLGRHLRALKLDELPQLLNVICGDMSLVGPRPQVLRFVERFHPEHRCIVLSVRPGITGPTQLRFRNEETLLEGRVDREQYYIEELLPVKCEMDVEYVQKRCVSYDLKVLAQTTALLTRGTAVRLLRAGSKTSVQPLPSAAKD
jgi:lipopolysaccharide/colanic/teichoic acid biosynthesis glycosyltransferase